MDYTYRRGDICWFRDKEPCFGTHVKHGTRPAIIVSLDTANFISSTVVIVPLTSNTRKTCFPGQFDIEISGFPCRVCCDQIRVVDKNSLTPPHAHIGLDVAIRLDKALREMMGLLNDSAAVLTKTERDNAC